VDRTQHRRRLVTPLDDREGRRREGMALPVGRLELAVGAQLSRVTGRSETVS
jgi:hypothetical protein